MSVAARVSQEMGVKLGHEVCYFWLCIIIVSVVPKVFVLNVFLILSTLN